MSSKLKADPAVLPVALFGDNAGLLAGDNGSSVKKGLKDWKGDNTGEEGALGSVGRRMRVSRGDSSGESGGFDCFCGVYFESSTKISGTAN